MTGGFPRSQWACVQKRPAQFICKTLCGVVVHKGVATYQVAPVREGRPSWSPHCPWPPVQEVPYPSRVRFFDAQRVCRWGFIVVDPTHPDSQPHVQVPSKREYARQKDRLAKRQIRARRGPRFMDRIAKLEEQMKRLIAQQKQGTESGECK